MPLAQPGADSMTLISCLRFMVPGRQKVAQCQSPSLTWPPAVLATMSGSLTSSALHLTHESQWSLLWWFVSSLELRKTRPDEGT